MPSKANTQKPYPYDLPPLPDPTLISETSDKRDRWNAWEFFRIEALLRSEAVWALYKQASRRRGTSDPKVRSVELWTFLYGQNRIKLRGEASAPIRRLLCDESLRTHFAIDDGWAVLLGSHHRYLRFNRDVALAPFEIHEGIIDLSALHRTPDLSFNLKYLEEEQSRYLYLRIDTGIAPSAIRKALEPFLRDRHKAVTVETPTLDPSTGVCSISFDPRHDPPIIKPRAWLKYFQCYDHRRCDGPSYGEIGKRVYGKSPGSSIRAVKKRRSIYHEVKRACANVEKLIHVAQKQCWPLPHL